VYLLFLPPPPHYKKRFLVIFFLFLSFFSHDVNAQSAGAQHWSENIFFSVSGQYYLLPDLAGIASPGIAEQYGVSTGIIAYPGFRTAAGYQWKKLSFSLETGYSYIKGDNPVVTDISLIPLLFKTGYSFYPVKKFEQFSLTPTLGIGMIVINVDHYEDALSLLTGEPVRSTGTNLLIQPGVRAGWNLFNFERVKLDIFTGLSLDAIFEKDGAIPLPQIELGVIVRPFIRKKMQPAAEGAQDAAQEAALYEQIWEDEYEEEIEEEEPEPIEPVYVRQVLLVYFAQNITEPTANEIAILDEAAKVFGEYIEATIKLRGYAAPLPTTLGHTELSRRRVQYCANYLIKTHEIPQELITIEWLGTSALPENIEERDTARRRGVEIIIEGWRYP